MPEHPQEAVRRLFDLVRERPPSEREAILDRECGADAALKHHVLAMLAAAADGTHLRDKMTAGTGSKGSPASPASPVDLGGEREGQMIGRYKLLQPIGEGGFGAVWMAEQREPVKRRVAVKVIKLGMDTRQVIARFEAERQALAMMDHPNIAKVLDAGATDQGRPYFVMEYIRGVPIVEYCDTARMDTRGRLDLFMSVCHAIQHAHQKGIVHRDIKPSNVLVTMHDGVPVPKVIDFGIAKATNQELTEKTLFTAHRQMIGTPAYMSPEQAEMSGLDIDTRSDIYSLGVLLYELLTGTTPFDSRSLMEAGFAEMMRIIREEEPHRPSARLSSLGDLGTRTAQQRHSADPRRLGLLLRGDLDWIVMKCLEKDRQRRYETASALAADIQRHLRDEPVIAGPPSKAYRLRKFVKRNRGRVIAAGVAAAILVLGSIGTTAGMLWALNEKSRADGAAEHANQAASAAAEARLAAESNEQRALAEAQRAERELSRATEIKRLITDMLTSVDPAKARGADISLLKGILDDAGRRLSKGEITDELIAAELHAVVGDVYRRLGRYEEAQEHLRAAAEIRTRVLGPDHPDTLRASGALALLAMNQGRYDTAEPLYLRTVELQKRVRGEDHPETILTMHNLAGLYTAQGRYTEAEPLYVASLTARRRVLGNEHIDTLATMNNLAELYRLQGRYAEAETLNLETLAIRRRVQGEEHPDTLGVMNGLANVYQFQGRYAEAEPLRVRTLEVITRVMGDEHPSTLAAMTNLAILYDSLGRYEQAEPLLLRASETAKSVLGEDHPGTLGALSSLAALYHNTGRHNEAEQLLGRTLETLRRVLGDDHPQTLATMSTLAAMYEHSGRYRQAEPIYVRMLEISTRDLGKENAGTLDISTDLGHVYNAMGRHDDAAKILEPNLSTQRRVLGAQHPSTARAMRGLADAYRGLGRHDEAIALSREWIDLQTAAAEDPAADPSTLHAAAWTLLTFPIEELRNPARALSLAERACGGEEAAGGHNLPACLDTLALAQYLSGDTASAIATQKRAISLAPDNAELKAALARYEAAAEAAR